MDTIIGLVMFYSWVHSILVISRKTKDTTDYEKGVLIAGVVGLGLLVIGLAGDN